jgi:hypothetical protein
MIVFDLKCNCGYTFEGWFQDRQDFDNQLTASFLVCPECGGRDIRKILSPIRAHSSGSDLEKTLHVKAGKAESQTDSIEALKIIQEFVENNFEDVGTELATESLKMHYGVTEPRNIRGVTSELEEKKLREEGINILKIPMPVKSKDVN